MHLKYTWSEIVSLVRNVICQYGGSFEIHIGSIKRKPWIFDLNLEKFDYTNKENLVWGTLMMSWISGIISNDNSSTWVCNNNSSIRKISYIRTNLYIKGSQGWYSFYYLYGWKLFLRGKEVEMRRRREGGKKRNSQKLGRK